MNITDTQALELDEYWYSFRYAAGFLIAIILVVIFIFNYDTNVLFVRVPAGLIGVAGMVYGYRIIYKYIGLQELPVFNLILGRIIFWVGILLCFLTLVK